MKRRHGLAALAACWAAGPLPCAAASPSSLEQAPRVSDEELAGQRGGFAFRGAEITLGAEIRSYLNGELVMQTNVNWSAAGAQMSRTVSAALSPAGAEALQAGILGNGGLSIRSGQGSVFLANNGSTAFIQRADGSLQNIIVNTASNVDLRQEVDARIDVRNAQNFLSGVRFERVGSALSQMIGGAMLSRSGN